MELINRLSRRIAKWLVTSGAITCEEQELFYFAVSSFLFSTIPLFLSLVLGSLFSIGIESILMLLPFVFMRKFSGGFHLKSAKLCFILTIFLLSGCLLIVKYNSILFPSSYLDIAVLLSSLLIFFFSPIDSKERSLSIVESVRFKQISRFMVFAFASTYFMLSWGRISHYYTPIGIGITIVAFLQIPCIVLHLLDTTRAN